MNGIIGLTDLTLDTELTPAQRENLVLVQTSAASLLRVIDDVLDFSKVEAGRLDLAPAPFALRDSFGATVKALAQRAHQKGLELICHVHPDVPDAVVGDALRLRQVLTNLVGNAIKFTERGEVVVRVALDRPLADGQARLHVTVRDTGIGIPTDKHRTIFDAFTQADNSTTRMFGGTGLGLAITSRLIELMGGRVWVESAPGAGSTFHFTARLGWHPAAHRPDLGGVDIEGFPVLVADDNATNRAVLTEVLSGWRLRPTAVSDGASAVATLEKAAAAGRPFPLVVLDALMPDIDGFIVAERIRRNPDLVGATIVVLSSTERTGDDARCRQLGIVYLRKPVTPSELLNAILAGRGTAPRARPESPPAAGAAPARERRLRILLAEDNEVNQALAVQILHKRGHAVTVVGTGAEAVAAATTAPFDLVLMDVQMPGMDGLQATAGIRERERAGGRRTPIVALTAHAMKGDRERCLAAGMDGYLSKPIKAAELVAALADIFPAAPADEVLDRGAALALVEGDAALLQKLVGLFSAQAQKLLGALRAAAAAGDGPALELVAHKLKGSAVGLGGRAVGALAGRLEELGTGADLAGAGAVIDELDRSVAALRRALVEFTQWSAS